MIPQEATSITKFEAKPEDIPDDHDVDSFEFYEDCKTKEGNASGVAETNLKVKSGNSSRFSIHASI